MFKTTYTIFYFFISLLPDLPYCCISLFCSTHSHSTHSHSTHSTEHIPLNTFPLNTFHSTYSTQDIPTQHIPLNTFHSTHSTQLYRSPFHCRCSLTSFISHNFFVLSLASCRLPHISLWSQFPLFLFIPNTKCFRT